MQPVFGGVEGDELEVFAVLVTEVEPQVITLGAHAGGICEIDVFEAENRFFVPWPVGFELFELFEKVEG